MSSVSSRPSAAYASLTGAMLLVGIYVALSKPLVAALPLFLLAWLRFAIAAPAMLPWTWPARGEPPLTPVEHRQLFFMSFFGNFLFSICMLSGIARTTATAAGVILATLPAAVALLSWAWLREQLSRRALVAVALAVGGIALLQVAHRPGDGAHGVTWLGNALMLGAVFCEAVYVILSKRLSATRTPLRVSAAINLWGLVLMAPLGIWQGLRFELAQIPPALWALLVFYALSASLFAVWLWVAGMRHVPAHRAGVFTIAMPASAALVGVGWLGEPFTWMHGAALLLAAGGVMLIATARGD